MCDNNDSIAILYQPVRDDDVVHMDDPVSSSGLFSPWGEAVHSSWYVDVIVWVTVEVAVVVTTTVPGTVMDEETGIALGRDILFVVGALVFSSTSIIR